MYEDKLVEVHCPRCGGPISYNENYFCQGRGLYCEWTLSHAEDGRPLAKDLATWGRIKHAMGITE